MNGTTASSCSDTNNDDSADAEVEQDEPAQVQGAQVSGQPDVKDTTEPIALVLSSEHLLNKIHLPQHAYEGRAFSIAPGTETLLCSTAKPTDGLLPRACYVYGVVCVSGLCVVGEHKYRSYFDPWVVLPKPVQSSKAWGGPNVVYVTKTPEHHETYLLVKRIVSELLAYPLTRQPLPSSGSTRSEPEQAPLVQEGVALKMQKLEMEKLSLEVL